MHTFSEFHNKGKFKNKTHILKEQKNPKVQSLGEYHQLVS